MRRAAFLIVVMMLVASAGCDDKVRVRVKLATKDAGTTTATIAR